MYDFPACVRCLPLVQSAMNKKVERWAGLCGNQSCPFQGLWRGNQYFSYTVSWNRKTVRISRQVKRAGYKLYRRQTLSFPGGSVVSACQAGDVGSIPGLGRSPGEGNGNLLQYSCLGNPIDRGTQWATVHGVTKESDMTEWLNSNFKNMKLFENRWILTKRNYVIIKSYISI